MISVYNILTELETWIPLSNEYRKRAIASKVNTSNNAEFNELVSEYSDGVYDEDIDLLHQRIIALL